MNGVNSSYRKTNINRGGLTMSVLDNKKVLVIGDRDGIPGQAIEETLKGTSADVVFSSTECFV